MALIKFMPGQKWPGFSFALYPLRVQGFYFALLKCSPIQAFTARFVPSMQLYRPHRKTAHRALQALFRPFAVFCRCCMAGAPTIPHRLRRAGAHHGTATLPARTRYHHHAGRCTAQRRPPIIIMYIRVQRCAPVMDPCQTVQHIADHASPAGSAPTVVDLWQVLHPAGQSSDGRRGTIDGYRRISFRAFAR